MAESPTPWRESLPRYIIDLDRVAQIAAIVSSEDQCNVILKERDRAIERLVQLLKDYSRG